MSCIETSDLVSLLVWGSWDDSDEGHRMVSSPSVSLFSPLVLLVTDRTPGASLTRVTTVLICEPGTWRCQPVVQCSSEGPRDGTVCSSGWLALVGQGQEVTSGWLALVGQGQEVTSGCLALVGPGQEVTRLTEQPCRTLTQPQIISPVVCGQFKVFYLGLMSTVLCPARPC